MFIPLVPKTSYLGDDLLTPWGDWFEVTVIYFFFPTPQRYAEVLGTNTVSARRLTEFWGRETADISEYEKSGSAMNAILTFKPVKGKRVHFHERIA